MAIEARGDTDRAWLFGSVSGRTPVVSPCSDDGRHPALASTATATTTPLHPPHFATCIPPSAFGDQCCTPPRARAAARAVFATSREVLAPQGRPCATAQRAHR